MLKPFNYFFAFLNISAHNKNDYTQLINKHQ